MHSYSNSLLALKVRQSRCIRVVLDVVELPGAHRSWNFVPMLRKKQFKFAQRCFSGGTPVYITREDSADIEIGANECFKMCDPPTFEYLVTWLRGRSQRNYTSATSKGYLGTLLPTGQKWLECVEDELSALAGNSLFPGCNISVPRQLLLRTTAAIMQDVRLAGLGDVRDP